MESNVMQVEKLSQLSRGKRYFLPSGNFVEVMGGPSPKFVLAGEREIDLPEEVVEDLKE